MAKFVEVDAAAAKVARPLLGTMAESVLGCLATLADQPQLRIACGSTIVVGLLGGDRRLALTGARMLLAHELATSIKTLLKNCVDRRRPRSLENSRAVDKPRIGGNPTKEESSFPSGHSGGAAAVARAFARSYPEHRIGAYTAAGAAALVQIPRAAHYPSDVAAGVAIGVAAEAIISRLLPNPAA